MATQAAVFKVLARLSAEMELVPLEDGAGIMLPHLDSILTCLGRCKPAAAAGASAGIDADSESHYTDIMVKMVATFAAASIVQRTGAGATAVKAHAAEVLACTHYEHAETVQFALQLLVAAQEAACSSSSEDTAAGSDQNSAVVVPVPAVLHCLQHDSVPVVAAALQLLSCICDADPAAVAPHVASLLPCFSHQDAAVVGLAVGLVAGLSYPFEEPEEPDQHQGEPPSRDSPYLQAILPCLPALALCLQHDDTELVTRAIRTFLSIAGADLAAAAAAVAPHLPALLALAHNPLHADTGAGGLAAGVMANMASSEGGRPAVAALLPEMVEGGLSTQGTIKVMQLLLLCNLSREESMSKELLPHLPLLVPCLSDAAFDTIALDILKNLAPTGPAAVVPLVVDSLQHSGERGVKILQAIAAAAAGGQELLVPHMKDVVAGAGRAGTAARLAVFDLIGSMTGTAKEAGVEALSGHNSHMAVAVPNAAVRAVDRS